MYRRELRNAGIRYENSVMHRVVIPKMGDALQIILDLCIPEKELAKTRSQISFI